MRIVGERRREEGSDVHKDLHLSRAHPIPSGDSIDCDRYKVSWGIIAPIALITQLTMVQTPKPQLELNSCQGPYHSVYYYPIQELIEPPARPLDEAILLRSDPIRNCALASRVRPRVFATVKILPAPGLP